MSEAAKQHLYVLLENDDESGPIKVIASVDPDKALLGKLITTDFETKSIWGITHLIFTHHLQPNEFSITGMTGDNTPLKFFVPENLTTNL